MTYIVPMYFEVTYFNVSQTGLYIRAPYRKRTVFYFCQLIIITSTLENLAATTTESCQQGRTIIHYISFHKIGSRPEIFTQLQLCIKRNIKVIWTLSSCTSSSTCLTFHCTLCYIWFQLHQRYIYTYMNQKLIKSD